MAEQEKCSACKEGSREAVFSWGDPDFAYIGRASDDYTWNGWSIPAFTAEEVRRMVKETEGVKDFYQLSEIGDSQWGHSFQIASYDARPDSSAGWSERVFAEECCGLYFIGGSSWTWAEVQHREMADR